MTDNTNIENAIENDILCYISSARNNLSQERLILNAVAFYDPDPIHKAKEILCKIANERFITRRASTAFPKPAAANI